MSPILTQHNHDMQHMMSPRNSMSITHTKGLLNGPGQNNCFLNSAVQVLWHLDIFRRSFRELSGHACMVDSCIFCALKELFTQFQYSHESALPPDALRRALAETFFNQQKFQLGFMDDAAECFENILLRIHFHIANAESEDMCNAKHCIPHQKFAMTLVEQGVCHVCGATSEPLPFTQMVHYISSSALCAQSKINRDDGQNSSEQFGPLLRKAGGMGEIRDCPSICGAKIQIHRTLMNRPDIVSIGIVWDSERPTLDHIMDVFHTIGTTIRLQDVFHSVVDDRWAASANHQLVGVVTYYGKHYSTFFFHTKLRVWIYFDDATVREIGPCWDQVVEKCRRGHFQPLLLLYANPYGTTVSTDSAPKTVTCVSGHQDNHGYVYRKGSGLTVPGGIPMSSQRRALTPNPEVQRDASITDVRPRRAITPNPELHHREAAAAAAAAAQKEANGYRYQIDSDTGYSSADRGATHHREPPATINKQSSYSNGYPNNYYGLTPSTTPQQPQQSPSQNFSGQNNKGYPNHHTDPNLTTYIQRCSSTDAQRILPPKLGPAAVNGIRGPLKSNGYFNNCDVPDGYPGTKHRPNESEAVAKMMQDVLTSENIYISRRAVESVMNYQKLQRQQRPHGPGLHFGDTAGVVAGNRNSNSSLESFENALRIRGQLVNGYLGHEGKRSSAASVSSSSEVRENVPAIITNGSNLNNVPRCRDSGNWSGDRNSASSTSSTSLEHSYYMTGNKRAPVGGPPQGYRYPPAHKTQPSENELHRPPPYDAGYDSFSLSSNDSFPLNQHTHPKHSQQLAQIPENVMDQGFRNQQKTIGEITDECQSLCCEADKFLEKSMERENTGDLESAITFCNGAAAKARAAMDAPYSNPQILAFARMKHNSCVMRVRSLSRRLLARQDSINSHGSSSTSTEPDSPHKLEAPNGGLLGQHSRQSSRDSTGRTCRRDGSSGNHSRQSSRDGNVSHSRQGSRDGSNGNTGLNRQQLQGAQDASTEKKRIELYGTLPKKGVKKKMDRTRTGSMRVKDHHGDVAAGNTFEFYPAALPASKQPIDGSDFSAVPGPRKCATNQLVQDWTKQLTAAEYSDYTSEWEQNATLKRSSSLHRTNSIPPNFQQHQDTIRGYNDVPSQQKASEGDTDGGSKNKPAGKKQHKIRRKLLMGGLIRRKNRSMPDLREGQNQSPCPESSTMMQPRAFDDFNLRKSSSVRNGLQETTPATPSSNSDHYHQYLSTSQSYSNLYKESSSLVAKRLYSSQGKIPPPPPVRTTSQLTTRSQSHGNLNVKQQTQQNLNSSDQADTPNTTMPIPTSYLHSQATHHPTTQVSIHRTASMPMTIPADRRNAHAGPACDTAQRTTTSPLSNHTMTVHADVHHERTPSDNIRPVCLARSPSINYGRSAHNGEISQRQWTTTPPQHQPQQPPQQRGTNPSMDLASHNYQMSFAGPAASTQLDGASQSESWPPPPSPIVPLADAQHPDVTAEQTPGGLLAELRAKRQQILSGSAIAKLSSPEASQMTEKGKQQSTSSDSWLQELQAKQQMMLNKRQEGAGIPTGATISSRINHEANPSCVTNGPTTHSMSHSEQLKNTRTSPAVPERIAGHGNGTPPMTLPMPMSTPLSLTHAENPDVVGNYKPKSVRDLANRFEKILLNPPTSASGCMSAPSSQTPIIQRRDVSDGGQSEPMRNGCSTGESVAHPASPASISHCPMQDVAVPFATHHPTSQFKRERCDSFKSSGHLQRSLAGTSTAELDSSAGGIRTSNSSLNFGNEQQVHHPPRQSVPISNGHSLAAYQSAKLPQPAHPSTNGAAGTAPILPHDYRVQSPSMDPFAAKSSPAPVPKYNNGPVVQQNDSSAHWLPKAAPDRNGPGELRFGESGNQFNGSGSTSTYNPNGMHLGQHVSYNGEQRPTCRLSNDATSKYPMPPRDRLPPPSYNPPPPPLGPRNQALGNGAGAVQGSASNSLKSTISGVGENEMATTPAWTPAQPHQSYPRTLTDAVDGPSSVEGPNKKKKGKKSVTFSDQIALVACAEDLEAAAIPNPLLEKVLHKSSMGYSTVAPLIQQQQPTSPPLPPQAVKTAFNPTYTSHPNNVVSCDNHLNATGYNSNNSRPNPGDCVSQCPPQNYYMHSTAANSNKISCNQTNGSTAHGFVGHTPPNMPQSTPVTHPVVATVNGSSLPKSIDSKVPCYLCRKKTVVPPTIYCMDCDFYMSRFKPKA